MEKSLNITALVQARMGSSRLYGKVMKKVCGKSLIELLLKRLSKSKLIKKIIVITPKSNENDILAKKVKSLGYDIFRGKEKDVLDRFYQCAKKYSLKNIVRITADNPLIDPQIIDHVIDVYKKGQFDYVSNCEERTFPYGTEVEVFSFLSLKRANDEAKTDFEREHVTPYIINLKENKKFCLKNTTDLSHLRWTVDEYNDFIFVKEIYKRVKREPVLLENILELIKNEPELLKINRETKSGEDKL